MKNNKIHKLDLRDIPKPLILSGILSIIILISSYILFGQGKNTGVPETKKSLPLISEQSLQNANGKNNNPCYIALNDIVYEVKQGNKWQNGEHTASDGQAVCGIDGTSIINNSPHKNSILPLLTEIGRL